MTEGAEGKWRWRTASDAGVWAHGAKWARPLSAAAPWLSLVLLVSLFGIVSKEVTLGRGTVFDLPESAAADADDPGLTVFVLPVPRDAGGGEETLVFFDDARFAPADAASAANLQHRLSARVSDARSRTLLILADRRVPAGDLMKLMALARKAGLRHVQVAERRE